MTVAYLSNQYPTTSHSFIRREIRALEQQGVSVDRYSIRSTKGGYVDPDDAAEARKTEILLGNWRQMLASLTRVGSNFPASFARALHGSTQLARRSDRGWVPHAAYLAEACVLLERFKARPVQHLHAHFGTNSATVAALCRELGGPPYSFTVHGPEEFDRALVLGLREKILGAKFVVAISEYGRSQLCRMVDREHWGKIHVVRCGLPKELLTREPRAIVATNAFVCVGRLHEQKGQFVLLDAAAELKRRGHQFRVVLAGDGPLRTVIEQRISELDLFDRVRVTGWLTQQQVINELDEASTLLLPSFAEGLPVVIMEALAFGRPAISTYVAGIPELVEPGINGWLVPAGSVDALVNAMERALACSAAQLQEMGRQGKLAVRARHDVDVSAARLRELFGEAGR